MSVFSAIVIVLAVGIASFFVSAGMALYEVAKKPRPPRHEHKWALHQEIAVFSGGKRPVGREYHLRCETCGDFKKRAFTS